MRSFHTVWVFVGAHWTNCSYKNLDDTIFLDLSKAFDLVNHDILQKELSHYGLHNNTMDWSKSNLHSRTQNSFISGEQSIPGKPVCLRDPSHVRCYFLFI